MGAKTNKSAAIGAVMKTRPEAIKSRVEKKEDAVNHPAHYGGDTTYEVIKVLRAWFGDTVPFSLGNAIKYIARAGKKSAADELEDLKKARWYIDEEIRHREGRK